MRGRGPAILAVALGVANGIYIFKPMFEEQQAQKNAEILGLNQKKEPTSTEAPAPTQQAAPEASKSESNLN
ncbi:hypothetical protein BJ508DRAFT_321846 [Ascobolus immersus RN42]|uniref:Uncharacterized protein n=1 Tax=Ascobolus immersus RN42 TaxID=1160509 RepID=A0A3N4IX20_ASCIM|nr:hypothetical protein BJ508DRAFT_321846 [Ascobolus immersus RN42]